MAAKQKIKNDLKLISDEASKVIDDLSHLGKVLAEAGGDQTKEAKEKLDYFLEEQISSLKKRMEVINTKVSQSAKMADKHVRANPYLYILGSLGLGFLLGKVIAPRYHE